MRHFNVFLLADVQVICQPDPTLRILPTFTLEGANKLEVRLVDAVDDARVDARAAHE